MFKKDLNIYLFTQADIIISKVRCWFENSSLGSYMVGLFCSKSYCKVRSQRFQVSVRISLLHKSYF